MSSFSVGASSVYFYNNKSSERFSSGEKVMVIREKLQVCLLLLCFECICATKFVRRDGLWHSDSSTCRLESGGPGECKLLSQCLPSIEEVRRGTRQATSARCGWNGTEEIVCCPTELRERIEFRPAELDSSTCRLESGGPGECKLLSQCLPSIEEVRRGTRQATSARCGWNGTEEIVCCPTELRERNEFRPAELDSSTCRLESGGTGECKLMSQCPPSIEEVRQGRRKATSARCGWNGNEEIVCCPTKHKERIGIRPAELACQQQTNEVGGSLSFHILSGITVTSQDLPFMAALGYIDKSQLPEKEVIEYNCGGSIIASNYVLTAAHCVFNLDENVPVLIRVGAESLEPNAEGAQNVTIANFTIHPRWRMSKDYNDIAVLKLTNPLTWTSTVKPICLMTKPMSEVQQNINVTIYVAGWGSTDLADKKSDVLLRTPNLTLVESSKCNQSFVNLTHVGHGINDLIICAIDSDRERHADACHGDSGGPLVMHDIETDTIIGVAAFGEACGSTPGGYTSVYEYLDWIEEQVWPDI